MFHDDQERPRKVVESENIFRGTHGSYRDPIELNQSRDARNLIQIMFRVVSRLNLMIQFEIWSSPGAVFFCTQRGVSGVHYFISDAMKQDQN